MNTGEDIQGLRKIVDFTRLLSIFILAIHFYIACYQAFAVWEWTAGITYSIIGDIARTGLFEGFFRAKLAALLLLVVSLIGVKGKKEEKIVLKTILLYVLFGAVLYFASTFCFLLPSLLPSSKTFIAICYIGLTCIGYLLILTGGGQLSRLLKDRFGTDIFNQENETFPQEERLLENEFSINLPARYRLGKLVRDSWVNVINPFRGLLVAGTPGAGKSYFVIRHIIDQHIRKGFSMFIYDFKFDDLSKIAYNKLLKYAENYKVRPKFFVINFDDLNRTHRCNPLDPQAMEDLTDATEASRTIMMGLNRDWIKKQGDFFVESPINFLTACIWYLRKYEDGRYCTLPHVIELMQSDYDPLFAVLKTQEEIKVLINPFVSAYRNNAMAQLEGQIASAKIGLARLSSPQLYYVLSGNDFTLDVNNPEEPKIVCVGNNPQKLQVYGGIKEGPETRRERGIPSWEPDMKPRERLLAHGPRALSDAELLAMLIGSGTPKETAVDLAGRILKAFGGLHGLLGATYKRLARFSGMGIAKCSAILSTIEISMRLFGRNVEGPSSELPA